MENRRMNTDNYKVPFGRYAGQTLSEAGGSDEGMAYLVEMASTNLKGPFRKALESFLKGRPRRCVPIEDSPSSPDTADDV